MAFLTRYTDDPSPPRVRDALRDMAVRAFLPAVALWLVIWAIGLLIAGPLGDLPQEDGVNRSLEEMRTAFWDTTTMVWSRLGNTEIVIGTCVVVVALVWWRTREWWFAVIPALAISVQSTVFVTVSAVIGRDRPEVEPLDPAPATSSFPSGHVGASTALYLTFFLMLGRVRNPVLRRTLRVVCAIVPLLVAYARLYRGMHHPTDVVVGIGNGVVCGLLAWGYLRRDG